MQEPHAIELGSALVSGSNGTMRTQRDTFQYVPLLDGLKSLLANQEICDEV